MPRDYKHNYKSPCIYHITINKAPSAPYFSRVHGPSSAVLVERSAVGLIVEEHIKAIPSYHPSLSILQYVVMPDHVHFLIRAVDYLPKSIGSYIGKFKVLSAKSIREYIGCRDSGDGNQRELVPIYEEDFYDRVLHRWHSLDVIYQYIRNNPLRLVLRRENREFFKMTADVEILGQKWVLYGNIQILDNPFKRQVHMRRAWNEAQIIEEQRACEYVRANGGVLVSPFISPHERAVIKNKWTSSKIILITNEAIPNRGAPKGKMFDSCVQGGLLIVAPLETIPEGRATWVHLNRVAEEIAMGRVEIK